RAWKARPSTSNLFLERDVDLQSITSRGGVSAIGSAPRRCKARPLPWVAAIKAIHNAKAGYKVSGGEWNGPDQLTDIAVSSRPLLHLAPTNRPDPRECLIPEGAIKLGNFHPCLYCWEALLLHFERDYTA
ncbi:unnamed protein product, partial [Chrysoparadoxa australica]